MSAIKRWPNPPDPELAAEMGAIAARKLEDGRILAITGMTYGKVRLTVSTDTFGYDDGW